MKNKKPKTNELVERIRQSKNKNRIALEKVVAKKKDNDDQFKKMNFNG
ncbi:MAG: hypothetical protein RR863_00920 [Erysipelotrichaceae bacterium]